MVAMMEKAMLPEGEKLSNTLSKEQMKLLSDLSGMPEMQLEQFKPWFASIAMLQKAMASVSTVGMDLVFQRKAKEANKRVLYLEEADAQIDMIIDAIDGATLKEALDSMVKEGITTDKALIAKLKELIAAYKTGDDKFDFAKFSGYTDEKLMEKILYRRNRNWIPMIESIVSEGNGFVAVGVMHLLGKHSVIELLSQKGLKATRVD
jgi:uncharacterized protein YbaP (TraB family)